ncbi:MAG: HEPN domain-containing protein [Spirochaetia bacterium]|nr:HEPN domain-containing protein [Spirochaetia bacterium]
MSFEYKDCIKTGKIREFSGGAGIAPKELSEARQDFDTTRLSVSRENFKWVTVQMYYSMLHAARSLLYFAGFSEQSHYCLMPALKEMFVKREGLIRPF